MAAPKTSHLETLRWHYRLGHPGQHALKEMQRLNLAIGFQFKMVPIELCEGCIYGKAHHPRFPRSSTTTSQPLQLIHSDLCGPMSTLSITHNKYYITFIDDFSRYAMVSFMHYKSSTLDHFKVYKQRVENQHNMKIKTLRTDNGGEYVSNEFIKYCQKEGIIHQYTVPHTPQQNGVAERKNRSLMETARSMLQTAGLAHFYGEEAVATACYLQNRLFTTTLSNSTPYSLWHGNTPDLTHLHIFGSPAYAITPLEQHRSKLDPRASRLVFVGYGDRFGVKAYRLFNPNKRNFQFNRSVIFHELQLLTTDADPPPNEADNPTSPNPDAREASDLPPIPPQAHIQPVPLQHVPPPGPVPPSPPVTPLLNLIQPGQDDLQGSPTLHHQTALIHPNRNRTLTFGNRRIQSNRPPPPV